MLILLLTIFIPFQTSAAVAAASHFPFIHSYRAHTTYYPLCSYLTLTLPVCNNTIEIVANTIISHTPLLLCLMTNSTFYNHQICIAHTLLSASFPLFTYCSYLLIPYYLHYSQFYDHHTLRPYLIFLQLPFNSTHKYDANCIDRASYLLHSLPSYKRSILFSSFAIHFTLIILSFSSHRHSLRSKFLPPNIPKTSCMS